MLGKIEQYAGEVADKVQVTDEAKKALLYGCAAVGAVKVL